MVTLKSKKERLLPYLALAIKLFNWLNVSYAMIICRLYQRYTKRKPLDKPSILIVRIDRTVGDTIMNSAFLQSVRHNYPTHHITLVCYEQNKTLVDTCPYIDDILTYQWKGSSLLTSVVNRVYTAFQFARNNIPHIPDIAFVPRFDEDHHAALIALFSLAKERISYDENVTRRKSILNHSFNRLFTKTLCNLNLRHEVQRGLDLVDFATGKSTTLFYPLSIWLTDAEKKAIFDKTKTLFEEYDHLICLGVSSGNSSLKQWPISYYAQLATALQTNLANKRIAFVLLGGSNDKDLGEQFISLTRNTVHIINFTGQTTLREATAIIELCDLYIGNDSGNIHLAASTAVPIIGVFGSSCSHRFSPWSRYSKVISIEKSCNPCNTGHVIDRCSRCIYSIPLCMEELSVDLVLEPALTALRFTSPKIRQTKLEFSQTINLCSGDDDEENTV